MISADLGWRVQEADRELASTKEQMVVPLTDATKQALFERIEHLDRVLHELN